MGESIDLVCPRALSNSSNVFEETHDYAVIYRVGSRHEFDNCIVDPNNYETVPILKCDKPHSPQLVKFTIYFVKYSPVPNALEFEEDKEYFFLSTSSGARQGLHYASGGLCAKFNMRFSITIKSTSNRPNSNTLLSKLTHRNEALDDEPNELDEDRDVHHRHASKSSLAESQTGNIRNDHDDQEDELKMSKMNLVVSGSNVERVSVLWIIIGCFLYPLIEYF